MGTYGWKPAFQRALGPLERQLIAWRVHPDWLTGVAVVIALGGGLAGWLANFDRAWLLVVPVAALLRLALNALDGLVARELGVARPWGAALNELGDRLGDMALLGGVALAPGSNLTLGLVVIGLALLVSHLGVLAKAVGGQRLYGGPMGKADRMLLVALAAPLAYALPEAPLLGVTLVLMASLLIVTAVGRLIAIQQNSEGRST